MTKKIIALGCDHIVTDEKTYLHDRLEEAGYEAMVYAGQYVSYIKYDQGALAPYLYWYPEYKSTSSEKLYPTFYYQMDYWQFSSSCTIDGIGGRVDANIQFIR